MLTPDKINEKSFQTTGRGSYKADDVDSFLNEVSASYEQMFKENGDLIRKISILAKKVEEYRADEESLKLALLNAQKLADKIVAEAKETAQKENAETKAETEKIRAEAEAQAAETLLKAEKEAAALKETAKAEADAIVAEANRQSNEILGNINRKVTHESLVYEMIQKEASEFKSKLVAMYKEHINLINKLPELADEQLDEQEKTQPAPEAPVEEPEEETITVSEDEEQETVVYEEEPQETQPEETEPEEEPAEETEDTEEEVPAEKFETIPEEPVQAEKKPFKLDLSKIDFTEDIDEEIVEAPAAPAEDLAEEESDDDDGEIGRPGSFKSFFKKK